MSLYNLFSTAVEPLPKSIIDDCTVWTTCLHNDGRYYYYKYEARDKQMLIEYANRVRASIDMMRSPSISFPVLQDSGMWMIELTYYGMD